MWPIAAGLFFVEGLNFEMYKSNVVRFQQQSIKQFGTNFLTRNLWGLVTVVSLNKKKCFTYAFLVVWQISYPGAEKFLMKTVPYLNIKCYRSSIKKFQKSQGFQLKRIFGSAIFLSGSGLITFMITHLCSNACNSFQVWRTDELLKGVRIYLSSVFKDWKT